MKERFIKNFIVAFVKTAVWLCCMTLFWWVVIKTFYYFLGAKGAFTALAVIVGTAFCSMLAYHKAKTED